MTTHKERMEKMSDQEKQAFNDKKKIAAQAYQKRKADAKNIIKDWLKTNPANLPANVRSAIDYLSGTGVRTARIGITSELRDLFIEKKTVSASELFDKYEYGNPTMAKKIKDMINTANPEDAIWVAKEGKNYVLKGTGPNPPKGWTGYIPVKKEEL